MGSECFGFTLPESWTTCRFGDMGTWLSGGTPSTEDPLFWNGDIPWITSSSLKCPLLRSSERKLTRAGLEAGSRLVPAGTLLFVVRGMSLKTEFRVGMAMSEMAFGQDCKAVVPHAHVDSRYLLYALLATRDAILAMVDEAGHGTGRLQTEVLQSLELPLPPFDVQRRIAHILGTLDDKIELNRRTNETLEAMARALFKSWFVDFEPVRDKAAGRQPEGMDADTAALFPDSFEESEIGEIPKGWRIAPLADAVEILSGGTPKTSVPEYWDGPVHWYTVRDAPRDSDVFVLDTERHITEAGVRNSATQILPARTTMISARGTVGRLALTAGPMAMNQTCYGLRPATGYPEYFTFFLVKTAVRNFLQQTHGTVFDTITKDTFGTVFACLASLDVAAAFERTVSPLLSKTLVQLHEAARLQGLRDALLPKLLSGDLCVGETEQKLATDLERGLRSPVGAY